MDHLKVYEAARDYLRDPDKWCQKYIETGDGARCLAGALFHASMEQEPKASAAPVFGGYKAAMKALYPTIRRLDPRFANVSADVHLVPAYNDNHTHAEVLELLNIAIAELQAEHDRQEEPATERESCLTAA